MDLVTEYPETVEGVDSRLGPGHVFREVQLIDGRVGTAASKVKEPADLMVFSKGELMVILFPYPEFRIPSAVWCWAAATLTTLCALCREESVRI